MLTSRLNPQTFLAQEPVLFPGTLRQNLDPRNEYPDEACEAVLYRIFRSRDWHLDTHIDSGGSNLSQGQRQLVGLTRAVLRRSAIVIMDEVRMHRCPIISNFLFGGGRGGNVDSEC